MTRFLEKRKCSCMNVSQTKTQRQFFNYKTRFFQGCLNVLNRFPAQQISQFAPFSLVVTILVLCVIFCYFAPFSRVTVLLLRAISTQQLFYFWRVVSVSLLIGPLLSLRFCDWSVVIKVLVLYLYVQNMFTTLKLLALIGGLTFLGGNSLLSNIAARR